MKNRRGITLIALVITIVVLIILAGVTISLTLGENGIFKRAEEIKQKDAESSSREKLELVLVDANIEKQTNLNYNKEEFLTQILEDNNITVEGNTVIVNNYVYTIDRENLVILESLGETIIKFTSTLQEYLGKNTNGKYEVSILLTVESNINMQSVVIENPDGTTFEIIPEGTKVAKDLTAELDETYTVIATTKDGKTETRTIIEKSEENIRTAEELVTFRDKVNSGLTYEGKTINLLNNLDLSSVCGETIRSWEPIGYYNSETDYCYFAGIFDGKYHIIDNLYINSSEYIYNGLFGYNVGTIKNTTLSNVNIYVYKNNNDNIVCGGIAGSNKNIIINCGINSGSITGYNNTTITSGFRGVYVGGIAGSSSYNVENCFNNANIKGQTYVSTYSSSYVGGIIGYLEGDNISIKNSYNTGSVYCNKASSGGITGTGAIKSTNYKSIVNCYSIGNVTVGSSYYKGEIIGSATKYVTINNCYYTNSTKAYSTLGYGSPTTKNVAKVTTETLKGYSSTLGDEYIDDVQDEEGNYLNDGYPILKWQIGE